MTHLPRRGAGVDRGPPERIRSVPDEKGEQPALEPEGDAGGCRGLAAGEAYIERLPEERVVQVERRRGDGAAGSNGEEQLVLQLLQPMENVLPVGRRREEGIRRQRG